MDENGALLRDEIQKYKSKLPNKHMKKEADRIFPVCFEKGMSLQLTAFVKHYITVI
jgi:hypothetical protein